MTQALTAIFWQRHGDHAAVERVTETIGRMLTSKGEYLVQSGIWIVQFPGQEPFTIEAEAFAKMFRETGPTPPAPEREPLASTGLESPIPRP